MLRIALVSTLAIFATTAVAQDAKEAAPAKSSVESVDLAKGGKLTGRVASIGAGKITFNDDTIGDVDLTPDQIGSLNTSRSFNVYFQKSRHSQKEMGKVTVEGGRLRFNGGDFNTGDMYRVSDSDYSLWQRSGSLSSALTYSDGNTEEMAFGIYGNLKYAHPVHELNFSLSGTYGESNGTRTTQKWAFMADYRYFMSETSALFAREELDHDEFADRDIRSVTTLGYSNDFWSNNTMDLRFEVGLTYTMEDLNAGSSDSWAGAMGGAYYNWEISDTARLNASMVIYQSLEESDEMSMRNRVGLTQTLWGELSSSLLLEHDYDNRPAAGVERNDFRAVFLLGWTF